MALCDKTDNCNAINYNDDSQECVIKACPEPIPSPNGQEPNYKGYAQISGKALIKYTISFLIHEIKWY